MADVLSTFFASPYALFAMSVLLLVTSIRSLRKRIRERAEFRRRENAKLAEDPFYAKLVGFNTEEDEWHKAFMFDDIKGILLGLLAFAFGIMALIRALE